VASHLFYLMLLATLCRPIARVFPWPLLGRCTMLSMRPNTHILSNTCTLALLCPIHFLCLPLIHKVVTCMVLSDLCMIHWKQICIFLLAMTLPATCMVFMLCSFSFVPLRIREHYSHGHASSWFQEFHVCVSRLAMTVLMQITYH